MTPPLAKLITFVEAADMLGFREPRRGRKVFRWIHRQPWADKVLVLLSAPDATRKNYRLSVAALRAHAPQLRPRQDELATMVREAVEEVREAVEDDVQEVREDLQTFARVTAAKVRELEAKVQGRTT